MKSFIHGLRYLPLSALLVGTLAVQPAWAKPAPWFLFQSKSTGHKICLQADPGKAWQQVSGPYRGPQCRQAIRR